MGLIPFIGSIPIIPGFVTYIVFGIALLIIFIIWKWGYGDPNSSSKIKAWFSKLAVKLYGISLGIVGMEIFETFSG